MKQPIEYSHSVYEFFYNSSFNDYAVLPKLKTQWTKQLVDELNQLHNIDIQAELEELLVAEMRDLVDRQILRDLFNLTPHLNQRPQ